MSQRRLSSSRFAAATGELERKRRPSRLSRPRADAIAYARQRGAERGGGAEHGWAYGRPEPIPAVFPPLPRPA
eukprot:scaffold104338_cov27-Tisochrysis_lutea.AAC.1